MLTMMQVKILVSLNVSMLRSSYDVLFPNLETFATIDYGISYIIPWQSAPENKKKDLFI